MFLEKIKQHANKIAFLFINVLLLAIGFLYVSGKKEEPAVLKEKPKLSLSDASLLQNAQDLERTLAENRQKKIDQISSNPKEISVQNQVEVVKTIPGATRKVATTTAVVSSKAKTAAPKAASKPAPAKKTKTS
jgi:hypothetical protein